MNKKLTTVILMLMLMSLIFSACAPAAAPVVTEAPVVAAATAVPTKIPAPTATDVPPTPEPALDIEALWGEMMAEIPADKGYGSVSSAKLNEELVEKAPFLLDVREAGEVEKEGFILGAVHIPVRDVLKNLNKLPAMDQPIVVYCASGHRGGFVLSALRLLGYSNVRNLGGGMGAWKKASLPVETGKPADPVAGTAPEVKDQALFTMLDTFLTDLPEGFLSVKADTLNVALVESQPFLLDVRSQKEYDETGYIAGAVHIDFPELFTNLDQLPAKDQPIVVYCASGHRGAIAQIGLILLGYEKVTNLGGGLGAWKAAKFPVEGWVDWTATWTDFLVNMPDGFYGTNAANLNAALVEKPPFLLDVRETSELEKNGYIQGSVHIPVREVLKNLDQLPAQDQPIVVYCGSGHRAALVMSALKMLGYKDVVNLGGGMGAWTKAELPVETGVPAAPAAGTAPEVNATMFQQLDAYLSGLPEGFSAINAADLNAAMAETNKPFVLDVREASELAADGEIEGAVHIPVKEIFTRLAELPKDKAAPVVVLCKSGHRGAIAMMALQMTGYTNVRNLGGGTNAWIAAELPVIK
jgi:rhodanese-related sulfurtransferase